MTKNKIRLLIAEDDTNFGMMLKIFLEMNQFEVTLCENGNLAIQTFKAQEFDLCILDVMMPHTDGFTVAENISKSKKGTPFIFLTAKALKEDQVKGYKLGALDYLVKPFDPEILLLKINVLLQKPTEGTHEKENYRIGAFIFDYDRRLLILNNQETKLSPKEAELLRLLCEKKGEILTHEEALIKIWKNDDYFTKQSMNVFVTKLRKYLHQDTSHKIEIENLHNKGMVLVVVTK